MAVSFSTWGFKNYVLWFFIIWSMNKWDINRISIFTDLWFVYNISIIHIFVRLWYLSTESKLFVYMGKRKGKIKWCIHTRYNILVCMYFKYTCEIYIHTLDLKYEYILSRLYIHTHAHTLWPLYRKMISWPSIELILSLVQ